MGCASLHDGEDSKSFDLQLSTSPPVFKFSNYIFTFKLCDCFCQLTVVGQLSCWTVAIFPYFKLREERLFVNFVFFDLDISNFEGIFIENLEAKQGKQQNAYLIDEPSKLLERNKRDDRLWRKSKVHGGSWIIKCAQEQRCRKSIENFSLCIRPSYRRRKIRQLHGLTSPWHFGSIPRIEDHLPW